ncbi:DUF3857 domain-containing protein [Candidatus Omnitrophota bacterium]
MKRMLYIIWIVVLLAGCSQSVEHGDRLKKADFYAAQGQQYTQTSINLYKELIKEEPKEEIKLKLGNLYLDIGRYQEAINCFLGVKFKEAKKKLAIAYFKNLQHSDALAQFERLGELDDPEYLYYYGQALEERSLYDKAIGVYSLISPQASNYVEAKSRIESINLSEETLSTQKIEEMLSNSSNQEDYPEAGALILLADESFEVFEDNTAEYGMHYQVKIFNERGKEEFSELYIGYDSTFEEVELEYARTIKPDGTVVTVGDKNIRDVSIYLNYPLYSNARAKIISMPEVAEGVIIEYRAKVFRKQMINKKDFILNYRCQEGEPIKSAKFSVKIPKDRSFNYKAINSQYNTFGAKLDPVIQEVDNKKLYSWRLENVPEILPEPAMSPASRINPIIMMSSFNKWEDVYTWWHKLYKDKIDIDADIKKKIDELVEGKQSESEKLKSIYHFCAQDIRYVAVEYGQAGFEPHEARDIFKNKYGDCKDQAILLIAMLRTIGIESYPVLIGTYDHMDLNEDFPSLVFNHCIAVVKFEGEWIFLDPTGQTVPFGDLPSMDQDRLVFLVLDDEYRIISTPTFPAKHNASHVQMKIKIEEDGSIVANRKVDTRGVFAQSQRYWLQFTKPKLIKETLEGTANGIAPGARLIDYRIENEEDLDKDIILEYEFQGPEYLAKADKSRLLPQFGSIGIGSVVKEERSYPIEHPTLLKVDSTTEVELPQNLALKYLPEDIRIDSEWFEFENIYTTKDEVVIFNQSYRLKKKIVLQQEYKEYKALIEDIARKINQRIILEEK